VDGLWGRAAIGNNGWRVCPSYSYSGRAIDGCDTTGSSDAGRQALGRQRSKTQPKGLKRREDTGEIER
jgi:hypothetical protein